MKKTALCIYFQIFLFTIIFAQSQELKIREEFKLIMAIDNSNTYEILVKSTPYVLIDNSILIYPGDKLYFEIELKRTNILSIKAVKENIFPEKTLVVTFEQKTKGKNHESMVLKIDNPFKYKLEYKALGYFKKFDKWSWMNVKTIDAKKSVTETYPDIISSIALSEFKFSK